MWAEGLAPLRGWRHCTADIWGGCGYRYCALTGHVPASKTYGDQKYAPVGLQRKAGLCCA